MSVAREPSPQVQRLLLAAYDDGGSAGATYLWSTVTRSLLPDLCAIRSEM
ncbi:hypothetical protein RB608_02430 [Nocardioides sp. LHD-245]|nr:hypothetical protein [Nocardioides sp. LHD-245]